MGVASSPAADRRVRTRRSIRLTFTAMVALPVVCLVALWAVAVALTPAGQVVQHGLFSRGHSGMADVAIFAGGALVVVLLSVALMALFARRLSRDISGLETAARQLADEQLPRAMRNVRDRAHPAKADQGFIAPRARTAEVTRTAAAIAGLRRTAIAAAQDEAGLRDGVAQVFVSLARRNQSLLQRQLRLIDGLEQKAADPAALADLFLLDHLTTRMRRHAENLIILSGEPPGRSWSAPVPVIDVLRGAVAEVEDYQRVRVVTRAQEAVTGSAVADMIHLLAELIENAALFSPSGTRVEVRAEPVANGFVMEVEDRGLGIQPAMLSEINAQLLDPADFALADPDRLGLFVVGKLATRHGIRVSLKASPYGGTTAVALLPHGLVVPATAPEITGAPEAAVIRPAGLGRPRDALILTGRADLVGPDTDLVAPDHDTSLPLTAPVGLVPGQDRVAGEAGPVGQDRPDAPGGLASPEPPAASEPPASPGPPATPGPPAAPVAGFSLGTGATGNGAAGNGAAGHDPAARADGSPGGEALFDPGATRGSDSARDSDGAPNPFSLGSRPSQAPPPADLPAGTYRGLPRRVRQASLSRHLRDNPGQLRDNTAYQRPGPVAEPSLSPPNPSPRGMSPAGGARPGFVPQQAAPADRTPEQARDFVASFRTGWRRDRRAEPPDPPPAADPRQAGDQDTTSPGEHA